MNIYLYILYKTRSHLKRLEVKRRHIHSHIGIKMITSRKVKENTITHEHTNIES